MAPSSEFVDEMSNTSRTTASLALGAVMYDKLAVGRSTYGLILSVAVSQAEVERIANEPIDTETVKDEVVVPVVSPVD